LSRARWVQAVARRHTGSEALAAGEEAEGLVSRLEVVWNQGEVAREAGCRRFFRNEENRRAGLFSGHLLLDF
jgi:hypothetical protein